MQAAVTGSGRLIAGRYRLTDPIGRGAMGIVWRGRDELLARDVAVKEVQVTPLASPADAEVIYQRTLREARTAARLSHPGVVKVFDVVEENGSPWIIMELVQARSLDQVIAEDGPLPPLQAAELGAGLLSALTEAHAAGVMHRDVKPGNVLITTDGRAVLTDFGIATFEEDPSLTQVGMVVGTPGFTAPERVRGGAASAASDLWSLGATLYAAVEGRGPFDRVGGSSAISVGVASEEAPRAPSAGPLGPVIEALLSRDPGTRPNAVVAASLLADAVTAARTGERPLGDGWPASSATGQAAAKHGAKAGQQGGNDLAFLDPPVFADLKMPEVSSDAPARPMLPASDADDPIAAASGTLPTFLDTPRPGTQDAAAEAPTARSQEADQEGNDASGPVGAAAVGSPRGSAGSPQVAVAAAASGQGGGGNGTGGTGGTGARAGWQHRSAGWRAGVAAAGVAALVIAGVVGWRLYSKSSWPFAPTPVAGQNGGAGPGLAAGTSPAPGHSGGKSGQSHGSTSPGSKASSPAGHSSPAKGGKPGHSGTPTPSSSVSSSPSPSPTTTPSKTPTTTPTTSPTASPNPPPAGFAWHKAGAKKLGTVAGVKMAAPIGWTQNIEGQAMYLRPPSGYRFVEADLQAFAYAGPVAEAKYLQAQSRAAHEYPHYAKIWIKPFDFRGYAAASWKFSWREAGVGKIVVLEYLVTLDTKAGAQPYGLSVSSPLPKFPATVVLFKQMLKTFHPLIPPSA
jgi:tRNA A-37 threonylcarbamoyl transferase component Bud32